MAHKHRQQTIAKRNRERAVEEKRTLKREKKQAERAAAKEAEESGLSLEEFRAQRAREQAGPGELDGSAEPADLAESAQPADDVV